jgi:hypothetical protein
MENKDKSYHVRATPGQQEKIEELQVVMREKLGGPVSASRAIRYLIHLGLEALATEEVATDED